MSALRSAILSALASGVILLTSCDYLNKVRGSQDAQLRIDSSPTGAVASVNGTARGETPLTLTGFKPGRIVITTHKDGFHDGRQAITLSAGDRRTVKIEMTELQGLILVHSMPGEADVTLDGAFRGKTPLLMSDFPAGTHRLKIARPGYFAKDVEVSVKDRRPQLVSVDLTSDAATLTVNSEPAGAAVLVNGANRGTTPCKIDALPSGEVQLELRLDGYAAYQQTVKLSAGQTFQVDAPLAAQPGDLQILTTPEKAKVYVDNQLRGEAPVKLAALPPGDHRIRVELKGYETDARDVKVKAGGAVTEEFRLQQNSGVLVLVTEPGGVRVLVDGEEQGETQAAQAGAVSTTFEAHFLSPGDHMLQLVRPGWTCPPKKFTIESGKAATMHEKMTRLFIPDVRVRTHDDIITGVLLREFASGDLEIEQQPGVIVRVKSIDVIERKPIKQDEK